MVAWWPGDGNASDIVNGSNGTLQNGATFGLGKVAQAFSFDGADDQILVPHSPNQNVGGQLTIDAWVYLASSGHGRPVLNKRHGTTAQDQLGGYTFETTNSPDGPANGLSFVIWSGGSPISLITAANTLSNNVWQHAAATYDGATMRIFVNGVEVASRSATGLIDATSDPLIIGRNAIFPSLAWAGLLDEVELFNRALSQSEIQSIFNAGGAGKCRACTPPPPNVVGWYSGDSDANDLSVTHNNATLIGGATLSCGKVGPNAFLLNGSDAYAQAAAVAAQDPTTAGSLDAWVYFNQTPSAAGHAMEIIGKGGVCTDFDLQADTDNLFRLYVQCSNRVASSTIIQTGIWYHVAGTWDATGMRIYVNGVLENTNTVQNLTRGQSNQPLQIGNQPTFGPRLFNGLIDEAEIFDRALSAGEIQAMANAGNAGKCKGPAPLLKITAVSRPRTGPQADHFLIDGLAAPNLTITIQVRTDFVTNFSNLGSATADASGVFHYDDATAIGQAKRFYRATYP